MADEQYLSKVYGDQVTEEDDGTFTVSLSPWYDVPIRGFPTRRLALKVCHAAHEAMQDYARNAMMD